MSEVMGENSGHEFDSVKLTCEITAAYVSNNSVPVTELPNLIRSVHAMIRELRSGSVSGAATMIASAVADEKPSATQIRKSVQHDGITSFIDGKTYKTLKRHLTTHGFDPRSYRERYGLPPAYPMVAPSYAERRSALAKQFGLGVPGAQAGRRRAGVGR